MAYIRHTMTSKWSDTTGLSVHLGLFWLTSLNIRMLQTQKWFSGATNWGWIHNSPGQESFTQHQPLACFLLSRSIDHIATTKWYFSPVVSNGRFVVLFFTIPLFCIATSGSSCCCSGHAAVKPVSTSGYETGPRFVPEIKIIVF